MDSDFTDRFSYLAAFLVAILGLAIFKDVAAAHHVLIFGRKISYLQLSLPLVSSMVLAVYFGALTLLTKRINFSLFPLGKVLGNLSDTTAALGLLYPFLLLITVALSFAVAHAHNLDHLKTIFLLVSAIQGPIVVYLATSYARTKEHDATEAYALKMSELESRLSKIKPTSGITPIEQVFELYERVLYRAKTYLRLRGYGVSGGNLGRVAQILENKSIFSADDVKSAKMATNLRNAYAHAVKKPDGQEYQQLITGLKYLDDKLGDAFYGLSDMQKEE